MGDIKMKTVNLFIKRSSVFMEADRIILNNQVVFSSCNESDIQDKVMELKTLMRIIGVELTISEV